MLGFKNLLLLSFVAMFLGCQDEVTQGPSEVHWDRDMCSRCVMVISDRKNTVQVQDPTSKKVYMFDDFGCMAVWFFEEKAELQERAVIWITDVNTGEWIDARKAFYTAGNLTPMAFGYSAHKSRESIKDNADVLTYKEVLKKIK